MSNHNQPPRQSPKADDLVKEIEMTVANVAKQPRSGNSGGEVETVRQGVADDLASFIEKHADDMMVEAQQHRDEAYAYAKEIRERTAEQIARLKAYTDSIKQSQSEMAEVRMRF